MAHQGLLTSRPLKACGIFVHRFYFSLFFKVKHYKRRPQKREVAKICILSNLNRLNRRMRHRHPNNRRLPWIWRISMSRPKRTIVSIWAKGRGLLYLSSRDVRVHNEPLKVLSRDEHMGAKSKFYIRSYLIMFTKYTYICILVQHIKIVINQK